MQLVVGIDEHSDTDALLECALDLAHKIEGQVFLLNVVEPDEATEASTAARGTTTEQGERFRRLASDYVWGSMSIAVESRRTDESVAACIARVCRLRRADIVVVASRRAETDAPGSVARELLRISPCPVLVITTHAVD